MSWLVCVAILAASAATLLAQTKPTTVTAGVSTPKGALKLLNLALREGNAKAIEGLLFWSSPLEKRMVEGRARYAAAYARLHQSAEAAFGEEGAKTVTSDLDSDPAQNQAAIEKADVVIDADQATVRYPGAQDRPIRLVRVGTAWKVALPGLDADATPKLIDQRLSELEELAHQAEALAAEIAGGKYSDADKAAQTWRNRVLQTVAPSTQPVQKERG